MLHDKFPLAYAHFIIRFIHRSLYLICSWIASQGQSIIGEFKTKFTKLHEITQFRDTEGVFLLEASLI